MHATPEAAIGAASADNIPVSVGGATPGEFEKWLGKRLRSLEFGRGTGDAEGLCVRRARHCARVDVAGALGNDSVKVIKLTH